MKKRKMIITLIILLVVGFASVSTTLVLNGTIGIGTNEDDFEVIFVEALLDGEESSNVVVSEDKKKITFSTNKLTILNQNSRIDYKVKNTSTQYGADVTITCNTNGNEYINIAGEFDGMTISLTNAVNINAQEIKEGSLNAKLIKTYTDEDTNINIICEINSKATSKESYSYTVNFDSGGGSLVNNKVVSSDGTYGELPIPEKEDYVFLGWYTDDGVEVSSSSNVEIDKNTTIHAKWAKLCPLEIGESWTFNYKGSEEVFSVPCDATYKLETWGAQGGTAYGSNIGGYGGYSTGDIELAYEEQLYINVGGSGKGGTKQNISGGYNGGGSSTAASVNHYYGSGGGATHIAKVSGLLSSLSNNKNQILIVSGGGGGGRWQANTDTGIYGPGGHGGGFKGTGGTVRGGWTATSQGGTQTKAGNGAAFGKGANVSVQGAGGGGYYGGAAGGAGAGGSGYIGNTLLTNKVMYCYNCEESTDETTKTISTTNVSSNPTSNYAKSGHGYAKITLVSLPY